MGCWEGPADGDGEGLGESVGLTVGTNDGGSVEVGPFDAILVGAGEG